MPRIIAKFGYMKPNQKNRSNFIEYISKRDGVIKNIQSSFNKPVTNKQSKLINELITEIPRLKNTNLYKEFINNPTLGLASELITEIEENHFSKLNNIEEYVEYIANRPRVLKEESHGLFSSRDDPIVLNEVKNDIKNHQGNVWTAIISLKREDAERLTYNNLKSWKILVRSQVNTMADNLQININNFKWYGAFHNESHHPHIHLVMYSTNQKEGYLNKNSIENIRSSFAKTIFKHDLMNIYKKQTHYRDELKLSSKSYIKSVLSNINDNFSYNESIETKLINLSSILKTTSGKHTYGYLKKPVKALVDEIVNLLSEDTSVKELLELWYEQRQEILYTYTDEKTKIDNLADIDTFRSIKNIVIRVADEISEDQIKSFNNNVQQINIPEPLFDEHTSIGDINIISSNPEVRRVRSSTVKEKAENYDTYLSATIKLLYHVSNMIEDSMIKNVNKYHSDQALLKNIKLRKIIQGHNKDD